MLEAKKSTLAYILTAETASDATLVFESDRERTSYLNQTGIESLPGLNQYKQGGGSVVVECLTREPRSCGFEPHRVTGLCPWANTLILA